MDRWKVEILDQLVAKELATGPALVAATKDSREVNDLADCIATSIWRACRPETENLDGELARLKADIGNWLGADNSTDR